MDVMDADPQYNRMPPSSVSFYFQNLQRSARVTSEALTALQPAHPVDTEAEAKAAYEVHWETLHAIALTIDSGADGVVFIRRYHLPKQA